MPTLRTALTRSATLALAVLACSQVPAGAQTKPTPNTLSLADPSLAPAATIDDVAWIAGYWEGDAFGGTAEEIWSRPVAGTMVGVYKLIRGDAVVFYEILTIVESGKSLVLRLKHFNPDLSGWEEKDQSVSFPLVKLEPGVAYFDGMTFRREHPDTLRIFLASRERDGSFAEHDFRYRRASPLDR